MILHRLRRCTSAVVLTLAWASMASTQAIAQAGSTVQAAAGTIVGHVIDQRSALPVSGAVVSLQRAGSTLQTARTNASGDFSFTNVGPGIYDVEIAAGGYAATSSNDVALSGGTVRLDAALVASTSSTATNYQTIGHVSSSSNQTLASATTISQNVNVQDLSRTGQIRVADQLGTLPALNISTSSSPGDDVTANIRGFGPTETGVLLDGHPVGPLGVLAPDSFNFADTPFFALSNVNVTYGSGALGLYGSDTIGGAIDLQLLNPTAQPHFDVQQQAGGYGQLSTSGDATAQIGKFGFALAAGVIGQYGSFANVPIFQSARPDNLVEGSVTPPYACSNSGGNDVSACNQAAETYTVSQNTKLTSELAKLRYNFSSATALTLSGYSAVQEADSTGNGDNDYLPYDSRLGQIEQGKSNCTTPGGIAGYVVVTNPIAGSQACYSAQQWAAVSSGPNGGGAGRNRSVSMRDYDVRFTTLAPANNQITLETYVNNYDFEKDSSLAGGQDANGIALGTPDYTRYYNTHGYLISDDIASANNDFGFGYSIVNQLQTAQELVATGTPNPVTGESALTFQSTYSPALYRESSFFLRDDHEFGSHFSLFANAWVKRSNVTAKTTFDPRITALVRPDPRDVIRLTYGRSDGPPAPELKSTSPVFEQDPGSSLTTVSCALNGLPNSAGNPNLTSEGANDFEFGYGRRLNGDSNVQVNAYVTSVSQQLISGLEPLTQFGVGNVTFDSTILQRYLSRLINQGCISPGSSVAATYPFLGVPTTFNIGHELARGIEISGRERLTNQIYVDYGYFVESSQQSGISDNILMSNPTLLNHGQQLGIPLHQATISVDYAPRSWDFHLDNYYVGANNPLARPAYWHSNAFITRSFDRGRTLVTFGGTNLFDSAVQFYGYQGSAPAAPLNQFATAAPTGLAQFLSGQYGAEEFGLTPPQVTATLTERL